MYKVILYGWIGRLLEQIMKKNQDSVPLSEAFGQHL